jgi:hypothetical protein
LSVGGAKGPYLRAEAIFLPNCLPHVGLEAGLDLLPGCFDLSVLVKVCGPLAGPIARRLGSGLAASGGAIEAGDERPEPSGRPARSPARQFCFVSPELHCVP